MASLDGLAPAAALFQSLADPVRLSIVQRLARGEIVVAAPGSAPGRYPQGNTGRARVGLTQPMPVPADLAALLTLTAQPTPTPGAQ